MIVIVIVIVGVCVAPRAASGMLVQAFSAKSGIGGNGMVPGGGVDGGGQSSQLVLAGAAHMTRLKTVLANTTRGALLLLTTCQKYV